MAKEKKKTEAEVKVLVVPLATRGRTFEGTVTKRFNKRVVLEFERTVFVQKYERFYKKKTRLHARLPEGLDVNIGDYIQVMETRPLSKIIHFIVTKKIRSAGDNMAEKKKQ